MTQFSIQWILSLIHLSQKWGQVHIGLADLLNQEHQLGKSKLSSRR